MRNVTPPIGAPLKLYGAIVESKRGERRTRLRSLRKRVCGRFGDLEPPVEALATIAPVKFKKQEKADLLHCYSVRTVARDRLLEVVRLCQPVGVRTQCPYCSIDSVARIDHYLPKTRFPEYSVHLFNLVPSCATCNERKGEVFREKQGRVLLHLYFDALPVAPFLIARIVFDGGDPVAQFEVAAVPGVDDVRTKAIVRHCRRLGLLERYREAANTEFHEARSRVEFYVKPLTAANVRESLLMEYERLRGIYSNGNWKAALYLAMANTPDFVRSLLPAP